MSSLLDPITQMKSDGADGAKMVEKEKSNKNAASVFAST